LQFHIVIVIIPRHINIIQSVNFTQGLGRPRPREKSVFQIKNLIGHSSNDSKGGAASLLSTPDKIRSGTTLRLTEHFIVEMTDIYPQPDLLLTFTKAF